jgi:predicted deacylase
MLRRVCERRLNFAAPALRGHEWLAYEIEGDGPGPALCVMAGMHVNEVAGILATRRLIRLFRHLPFRGRISILPIVDPPALPGRCQHLCPIDNKNINFCFPGRADGTFSEALADALLQDWAGQADLLIDLHGGDLCEVVAPFMVVQCSGDSALDQANLALARAFHPAVIVFLPQVHMAAAGRSCTGRAIKRQRAVFAEAGANGLLDDASVAFHVDGVCRAAAQLGMIDSSALAASPSPAEPVIADSYHWLAAETEGWCDYFVQAGERVQAGQVLAQISDDLERPRQRLLAPQDGIVLWRDTHPLVSPNAALFGIGGVASWPEDRP